MTATVTRQVHEPLAPGLTRTWDVDEVLAEVRTEFQHVLIGRTHQGVSLFCDNDRQSTEFSQLVYHEALLVPGLLLAERVDRVLVVGSSEGVVSQLCVAAGAGVVDHVDIDAETVRLCAKHLPYGYAESELDSAERGEGAVRVHYADGWEWVRRAAAATDDADRYDIVLVDLPDERPDDPQAQHNRLYGTEFLALCRAACTGAGWSIGQVGLPDVVAQRHAHPELPALPGGVRHGGVLLLRRARVGVHGRPRRDARRSDRLMCGRLATCAYQPASIDAEALRSRCVPPYHVRHAPRIV